MATVTAGYSFGSTETVTNTKLATLLTSATVTGIVNADVDAGAAIANSKLNLASVAQALSLAGGLTLTTTGLTLTSVIAKQAKGADVASAAGNIVLGNDGNYFDITGTSAITSITIKQAGTVVTLQFDSTATLTDGSNLTLQGNFTGAAGATITLVSDGTNWVEVCRNNPTFTPTAANALSGSVIQNVYDVSGSLASSTTVLPYDNSLPTNSEGDATDLSVSITPNNNANTIEVNATVYLGSSSGSPACVAALFEGTTCVAYGYCTAADIGPVNLFYRKAGSVGTSAITYTVRFGPGASGTVVYNGDQNGTVLGSTATKSYLKASEIKA